MSKVLATDLDGTFIPLKDNAENQADLEILRNSLASDDFTLTFVTGRHLQSVEDAIERFNLPVPQWIICDVGSSIYQRSNEHSFEIAQPYHDHLAKLVGDCPVERMREHFAQRDDMRLQEEEKQGKFKISFYCNASKIRQIVDNVRDTISEKELPYHLIGSVDPFNGDGLIDLLPLDVSKAYALEWWTEQTGKRDHEIAFAGDSGNDLAALTAGHRTIVVGNASPELVETVHGHYAHQKRLDLLYIAEKQATSGVLAGCRHFGLI